MKIVRSTLFDKQYLKLSKKIQQQFGERLMLFISTPHSPLLRTHALAGEFSGLKSFNVNADVRVIYEVQKDSALLLVAIGTHSQLYR